MKVYDVTLPVSPELPVWPGDPAPELVQVCTLAEGALYNLSVLRLSVHTGTHLDAPSHFVRDGDPADRIPLETLIGDAWVCRLPETVRTVTAEALDRAGVPVGTRRLLLATGNGALWDRSPWSFTEEYVALARDAADWVVARGILLLGIDYLSVDPADAPDLAAHRTLLSRGVVVVEAVDLRAVPAGPYRLFCLPLKLKGAEGAPARVVLVAQ